MKIAIILNEMSVGGIPRACLPLMEQLKKYAALTLVMANENGALQSQVPSNINVISIPYKRARSIFKQMVRQKRYVKAVLFFSRSFFYGHLANRWVKNNAFIASHMGYIVDDEFDCAIAYHGMNVDQLSRTLYNINAKKKVAWIHGDHPFIGIHKNDAAALYSQFDKIYVDSEMYRLKFVADFNDTAKKTEAFHCLLNMEEVRQKASEDADCWFDSHYVNILTVGRISPEKGQDMIPDVLAFLNRGDLRWYLVGDGPDRSRIERLLSEKGCSQLVILGAKTNPYPYIKNCDIYVQPSYSECYSLTALEAATLGKPIVITDVAGATEVLQEDEDAVVVSPNSKSIALGITRIINDELFRNRLINNVQERDFSNYSTVKRIIDWIVKD